MEADPYLCIGLCMSDPDSGCCLGCGRPPMAIPEVAPRVPAEPAGKGAPEPLPAAGDSAPPSL